MKPPKLALVLDIDGTLIDSTDCDTVIHKRPGVDRFLDDCFAMCKSVAIWTHAGRHWAQIVTQEVLLDADGQQRPWAFVWSSERVAVYRPINTSDYYDCYGLVSRDRLKPLLKVWRGRARVELGFTPDDTLIIEDTPLNCKLNYGNAVYVASFSAADTSDDVLPRLSRYLHMLGEQLVSQGTSVRNVEKRWWLHDVPSRLIWQTSSEATASGASAWLPSDGEWIQPSWIRASTTASNRHDPVAHRRCVCYSCLLHLSELRPCDPISVATGALMLDSR